MDIQAAVGWSHCADDCLPRKKVVMAVDSKYADLPGIVRVMAIL